MSIARVLWVLLFALLGTWALCQERVIKAGDRVTLTCEEEASLNRDYTVTRDGLLVLPFIGAIEVAGMTETAAAARVADRLIAERIVTKATVAIRLADVGLRPIRYAGAVKLAGDTPFKAGMRLKEVILLAEPTEAADLSRVEIQSASGEKMTVDFARFDGKNEALNPALRAGDLIFIPVLEAPQQVFVLGAVVRPGAVPFKTGLTARGAIAAAGGVSAQGDLTRVALERGGQILDLGAGPDPVLEAGDKLTIALRQTMRSVSVQGEVARPGTMEMTEGLTVAQAIQRAMPTGRARLDRVTIARRDGNKTVRLAVNVEQILRGFATDPPLFESDTVLVPAQTSRRSFLIQGAVGAALLFFLVGR